MLKKLGMIHPIFQAPMAGVTRPEFVAASAQAGVMGAIGAGYLNGEETRAFIRKVKELTNGPFMVNLFVPEEIGANEQVTEQAISALKPIRQSLGLKKNDTQFSTSAFNEQVEVILEEDVKVCSFTFGLPDKEVIKRLKRENVFLIGTATTKHEALLAERAGMDAVVVQGCEAGGHRGSFDGKVTLIPLEELLQDVRFNVQIPVIAAGGIANKALATQALSHGATAVQIGTALLAAKESGAHDLYKREVLQAREGSTVVTNVFSGKMARGLHNAFIEKMKDAVIAPYPLQNDLTKAIRKEAAHQKNTDYMSLWAGENVHLSRSGSVQEIIARFI